MPTVTINDQEYDMDELSEDAKAQLVSLQATDRKINDLKMELAIMQTARNAYARAITDSLPQREDG